jgi:hypothetical protein
MLHIKESTTFIMILAFCHFSLTDVELNHMTLVLQFTEIKVTCPCGIKEELRSTSSHAVIQPGTADFFL